MNQSKWKNKRVIAAITIAAIADLIQFPLTAVQATVVLAAPAEVADVLMDSVVMVLISCLIGFNWLLLPSLFVEFVPGLDLIPTWTGCVLFLVNQQNKQPPLKTAVVDVEELRTINSCPPPLPPTVRKISLTEEMAVSHLQLPLKSANGVEQTCEAKLRTAQGLFDKRLISQAELDAKRQQILSEI